MKKRFYVYSSWKEMFELLSDEERSTMLMNLFNYQEGIEPVLNTAGLKMAWASMKFLLEKDDASYKAAVQRANNANPPKTNAVPQIKDVEPQKEIWHRIDNVNVNDKVNENGEENKANEGDKDKQWFLKQLNKGRSFKELNTEYPMSSSLNLAVKEWVG